MTQWKVKKVKRTEPYRYLVILLEQDGNHKACGHERYQTKEQAIARAGFLAHNGQRCDVLVDVAASFGAEEEYVGKVQGKWSSTYPNPQNIPRQQSYGPRGQCKVHGCEYPATTPDGLCSGHFY